MQAPLFAKAVQHTVRQCDVSDELSSKSEPGITNVLCSHFRNIAVSPNELYVNCRPQS